jgi:GTP-binding protein
MSKKALFSHAEFITSAMQPSQFPTLKDLKGNPLPEIAFAGKSNVGKSSLLNHLLRTRKLAKTSATPGKTSTLNFFLVDNALLLVDLPGYGFAKKSKADQKKWSLAIDSYLTTRSSLKLILLLLDSRHPPSKEDLLFLHWLMEMQKPFLLIFTKTDKLPARACQKQIASILQEIENSGMPVPCDYVSYSTKDLSARASLLTRMQLLLE